ncbi:MAG TPA: tetratricopeptide repeat protein [Ignavibacteriaceae bacterium]|jgi:tetratricopeptide (TPR) repeat protein|nr:MAG: Tetratricopeptide repeat protein [Ignavibacteria bacterium ADurb.Bin266]OQY70710.1 MAG: hypothetical protein B6D44_14750 [Ignavibacteriales bacterium UTCHB2]HQF43106.1 tetratricopeptide repeat protein [Ignavibacteriaceae bacterium]HQI41049.1 tetratricopeptide repeat protein [Ignavibacteriaceae bacterium]
MKYFNSKIILILIAVISCNGFAQSDRSTLNKGVDKYEEKKFVDAEVDFKKVVEKSPKSFEANFNLGDSYYKQGKYEDAIKSFQSALESAKDNDRKAKVYHNIGNSLLKSDKVEQSVEAYKTALKYNPNDNDTKYNLSYALELLKNKDKNQQNKNDQNKKDQDKQNQNQDKNQDQQSQEQNKQDQQQSQPKDQEAKQDNTKQQPQPKEEKISKEEAQRILDALKNNEKDLQKQIRKRSGQIKKTDKDW